MLLFDMLCLKHKTPDRLVTANTITIVPVTTTSQVTGVASTSGVAVPDGGSTAEARPIFSGTISKALASTEFVRVYDGSTVLGYGAVTGTTWSLYPNSSLALGSHTVTAVVARDDLEGSRSPAWTFTVIDPTAVSNATEATITYVATTTGASVASGASTTETKPNIIGSLSKELAAGESIRLYSGSTVLGTATVFGTTWSFTPTTALAVGTYSFTATIAKADGTLGFSSGSWKITVVAQITCVPPQVLTGGVCVSPSTAVTSFYDGFDGTSVDSSKWTQATANAATVSGGLAQFRCQSGLLTRGKVTFAGSQVVVEARMAGTSSGRDTVFALIDANGNSSVQVGDTNYYGMGLYILATGSFSLGNQAGIGSSTSAFKEYRLTLSGKSLKLERGNTLAAITETINKTLPNSIVGTTFYLSIWTAQLPYCPGTFDWIRVTTN